MSMIDNLSMIQAPSDDRVAPSAGQLLANTGTTEAHNATALRVGAMATLQAGSEAVRISFRTEAGVAAQVALTSMRLAAGTSISWLCTPYDKHVYVEAADAASAYEAWVWTSSFGGEK